MELISRKLQVLTYVFDWLYFTQCQSASLSYVWFLINVDEVLLIKPSANVFVFEDFNVHHKDWLTFSGDTFYLIQPCSDG